MEYETGKNEIKIFIPASNKGKFRFKNRANNFEFGNILATRSRFVIPDGSFQFLFVDFFSFYLLFTL